LENELKVPTMAELFAAGQQPEVYLVGVPVF